MENYLINILVNFLFYISIPIAIRYVILRKPIKSKWIAIGILVPIFIGFSILINIQRDEGQKKIYQELNIPYKPRPHMIDSPMLYAAMALSFSILRRGHKNSEARGQFGTSINK
jgi:cadmium resistance protein CadD (predicted permease)